MSDSLDRADKSLELDIATGKVLFEWSSLDHVQPDESVLPINSGQAGSGYNSSDAWDYFHINSVDKDADGNYLISARDACAVHKINGTDGEIIWVSFRSLASSSDSLLTVSSRLEAEWQAF